jgi:antitoxin component YwqK of YwqJK toxin-antitoxin module
MMENQLQIKKRGRTLYQMKSGNQNQPLKEFRDNRSLIKKSTVKIHSDDNEWKAYTSIISLPRKTLWHVCKKT